jgi:ribosome biogenesis protein BMS1
MAKRAVILEPEDRKKRAVVDMLSSIRAEKTAKRGVKQAQRLATFSKKKEAEAEKFEPLMKEQKKRKFAEKGKEELHRKKRRE